MVLSLGPKFFRCCLCLVLVSQLVAAHSKSGVDQPEFWGDSYNVKFAADDQPNNSNASSQPTLRLPLYKWITDAEVSPINDPAQVFTRPRQPPQGSTQVNITLNMDYNKLYRDEEERSYFARQIIREIAHTIRSDVSRLVMLAVTRGSVKVAFAFIDATLLSLDVRSNDELLQAFLDAVKDRDSRLYQMKYLRQIDTQAEVVFDNSRSAPIAFPNYSASLHASHVWIVALILAVLMMA